MFKIRISLLRPLEAAWGPIPKPSKMLAQMIPLRIPPQVLPSSSAVDILDEQLMEMCRGLASVSAGLLHFCPRRDRCPETNVASSRMPIACGLFENANQASGNMHWSVCC